MTQKNLNIQPYYDDFNEFANHHQILFKPGFSVQARELTQLQSILKQQIAAFGNHIFQQGSIVIPGNSFAELGVQYVKIEPTYSGQPVSVDQFIGKEIYGLTSGVKAIVTNAVSAEGADPDTLYLSYTSGGNIAGVPNGKLVFDPDEIIQATNNITLRAKLVAANATGLGQIAYVNAGVYYVNGTFVSVQKQQVIIQKYDLTPQCKVLLQIRESIIDSIDDSQLLDPAQGSENFAAPGADRYKLELVLTKLNLTDAVTDNYVEIMRYENGELLSHTLSPKYSELDKALAKRTYDESGNYIVSGFNPTMREHNKTPTNGGLYSNGDAAKFIYELPSGKAYFNGFALENLNVRRVVADKARTNQHIVQSQKTMKVSWGQYLTITDPIGRLDIRNKEQIDLYNVSALSGGTKIGTAKVFGLDHLHGESTTHVIYKMYVSDMQLIQPYTYDDIGSARSSQNTFNAKIVHQYNVSNNTVRDFTADAIISINGDTPSSITRTATVSLSNRSLGTLWAHKHNVQKQTPRNGDTILVGSGTSQITAIVQNKTVIQSETTQSTNVSNSLIFQLPLKGLKTLKDDLNSRDMSYTVWRSVQLPAGATQIQASSGTVVPIEIGTFIAMTLSGVDDNSSYSLNDTGAVITRSQAAPVGGVTIYFQSRLSDGGTLRFKTPSTHTMSVAAARDITLQHPDVYELVQVTHTSGANTTDVTTKYKLLSGQTDYEYKQQQLELNSSLTIPAGVLTINYKYFSHSAGDYFTVDSYPQTYITDTVLFHTQPVDGVKYSLRDCIDFRSTYGSGSDTVVPNTFITTSIQNYAPRYDVLCVDNKGDPVVLSGTPSLAPKLPVIPNTLYALRSFYIPEWTYQLTDIETTDYAVYGYQMEDISRFDARIQRLEEFTTLTAAEAEITNTPFLDAETGLDRFKTGFLVESMVDPFLLANTQLDEFNVQLDPEGIQAQNELMIVKFDLSTDAQVGVVDTSVQQLITQSQSAYVGKQCMITGGMISLPYYDTLFASATLSSRITNVNPFNVFSWNGILQLNPPMDLWTDRIDNPDIVINTTNTIVNWLPRPQPPPPTVPTTPQPASVFGPAAGPAGAAQRQPVPAFGP